MPEASTCTTCGNPAETLRDGLCRACAQRRGLQMLLTEYGPAIQAAGEKVKETPLGGVLFDWLEGRSARRRRERGEP